MSASAWDEPTSPESDEYGFDTSGFDSVDDTDTQVRRPSVYTSPLMAKMADQQRSLTTALLAAEVPIYHAGLAAQAALEDDGADLTPAQRRKYNHDLVLAEGAKERLLAAGMPLIGHLAKQELNRRQNWRSPVTFEEIVQEGVIGYLRGLRAFKVTNQKGSPTNYLGMWIQVEIRRNVETLDNDFKVPYDHVEKFRRIRAVRSRLINELGRQPTDEEVEEAAGDPSHRGGAKLGRVNKTSDPTGGPAVDGKPAPKPKSAITVDDIAAERDSRNRVGPAVRAFASDTDGEVDVYDYARSLHDGEKFIASDQDAVDEGAARDGLNRLLTETFNHMTLSTSHRDIISRKYGLPPHEKDQAIRQISADTGIRKESVEEILEAFQAEMARPGGPFHYVCASWSPEDLASLGLGWTVTVLGRWDEIPEVDKKQPIHPALASPVAHKRGVAPPPDQPDLTRMPVVRAQFVCDYHAFAFIGVYPSRDKVPRQRDCPQPRCGRPSTLNRVMST